MTVTPPADLLSLHAVKTMFQSQAETEGASSVQNATRTAKTESSIDFADSVELDGLTSARTNLVLFLSLSRSLFHAPFLAQLCR